jgi:hypothetical protein
MMKIETEFDKGQEVWEIELRKGAFTVRGPLIIGGVVTVNTETNKPKEEYRFRDEYEWHSLQYIFPTRAEAQAECEKRNK